MSPVIEPTGASMAALCFALATAKKLSVIFPDSSEDFSVYGITPQLCNRDFPQVIVSGVEAIGVVVKLLIFTVFSECKRTFRS